MYDTPGINTEVSSGSFAPRTAPAKFRRQGSMSSGGRQAGRPASPSGPMAQRGSASRDSPKRPSPLFDPAFQDFGSPRPSGLPGSNYVRWVQRALNDLLGLRLRQTGIMDAPSRSALRTFQRQQGLPANGRLGPATRGTLLRVSAFAPLEDGEIDNFLGSLGRGIARAAKSVGRAATAVSRVVPVAQLAAAASRAIPFSTVARAAWGGVAAGLEGKNVLSGAVRVAVPTPLGRFALDAGRAVVRGENVARALKQAAGAGISDVREQLRFAQMVAPFVPGIGTGVSAALGAANALAEGKPITEALVAGARGALPGGAVAQAAFDVALKLAQGKKLSEAALTAARNGLPGGPLARAGFDTAVALAEGKRLQEATIAAARQVVPGGAAAQAGFDLALGLARGQKPSDLALAAARARLPGPTARAAFDGAIAVAQGKPIARVAATTAGRALPAAGASLGLNRIQTAAANAATRVLKASPYAADALSFAKAAARGQNIQRAALSSAGKKLLASVRT
jgi:peptidoglycan hydrolase-like protein with peptidoglycan-binding domain